MTNSRGEAWANAALTSESRGFNGLASTIAQIATLTITIPQAASAPIAAATILMQTNSEVAIGRMAKKDDIWSLPQISNLPKLGPYNPLMRRSRPTITANPIKAGDRLNEPN